MAQKSKAQSKYQGQPTRKKDGTLSDGPVYYIVNPSGCVHSCTRDHALEKLQDARYRLAEDHEVEMYLDTKIQEAKAPFGTKWDPEPDILVNVPEPIVHAEEAVKATQGAKVLAGELGVDLTKVTPTGANGQILKKDVQAHVEGLEE